jgi:secreted Zn-dependent insulinase-like peptidase
VAEYDRVLQLLFAYLDLLREEGPKRWLYEEQSQLAELAFRFKEEGSPISYVAGVASGMHYYPGRDILRGPYVMRDYQADMIAGIFSQVVPENALVILSHPGVATDRVSAHYGVPYSVSQVGAAQLASWQGEVPAGTLAVPAPNMFIAEDVSLVDIEPGNPEHPTLVLEAQRQRIWFLQDETFRIPKGATYINFRSPYVGQSPEQAAAAVLYTALLKDQVNEYTYPALLAGLNFSFYKHAQGMSMRISGYDDKQAVLLRDLLAEMKEPTFSAQRFDDIRKDMIRSLENVDAKRPSSQAMDDLREALLHGQWGEQALIDELSGMQLSDLEAYAHKFWASANAEALVYGNYTPAAVRNLSAQLESILPDTPAPPLDQLKVTRLSPGDKLLYPVAIEHDDAVLAWYLQGAGNTWEDRAATALTAQIMKSGFFQQLRTEQQLGYIVSAFSWPQMDVPGLVMLIQSPVADAAELAEAMAAFLVNVDGTLTEEQFLRHRTALVNEILRPDKNLWERAEFYWQSIAREQFEFDGREALAGAVEALTLADWKAYFREVFVDSPRSLQVAAPGKGGSLPAGDRQRVPSADAIKASHDAYVVH